MADQERISFNQKQKRDRKGKICWLFTSGLVADRGGPLNSINNQTLAGNVPTTKGHCASMGYVGEFQLIDGDQTKKNPGAAATASEVKSSKNGSYRGSNVTTKNSDHASVQRGIGHALTLGNQASWDDLAYLMALRLSPAERVGMLWAAVQSLDDNAAYMTVSLALFGVMGGEVVR